MSETNSTLQTSVAEQPLVTIMIPTKNRIDSLQRLLGSIHQQDYKNLEIVVIDDGSEPPVAIPDNSIHIIRNDKSRGQMFARNQGLEYAHGEFVIHFDDDTEITDVHAITKAVNLANKEPQAGAIGFMQLTAEGKPSYMQPQAGEQLCYTSHFFGYAFLLRKQTFLDIGGFNEYFQYYYDEIEFCLRLYNAGYVVIYDPSLKVIHYHDPRGRDWRRIYRLTTRNAILTAFLHYPIWLTIPALLKSILNHIKLTRASSGSDWSGITWILRDIFLSGLYIKTNRKPMPYSTLLTFRNAKKSPVLIHAEQ